MLNAVDLGSVSERRSRGGLEGREWDTAAGSSSPSRGCAGDTRASEYRPWLHSLGGGRAACCSSEAI